MWAGIGPSSCQAVLEAIGETSYFPVSDTEVVKGAGIIAAVDGRRVAVGNQALMEREGVQLNEKARADIARLEKERQLTGFDSC